MKLGTYKLIRTKNHYHILGEECRCGRPKKPLQNRTKSLRMKKSSRKQGIPLYALGLAIWAILTLAALPFIPTTITYAATSDEKWGQQQTLNEIKEKALEIKRKLTVIKIDSIGVTHSALVTGYNSLPEQTDDTPFITASGQRTRDGIVANNCLPFGSKVLINGKIYEVQDRMNKRYGCDHYDIWMEHYQDARNFGAKRLEVTKLLEPGSKV